MKAALRFVLARAHLRALMTQKSCAVGMRNAKVGNHLNIKDSASLHDHSLAGQTAGQKRSSSNKRVFLRGAQVKEAI